MASIKRPRFTARRLLTGAALLVGAGLYMRRKWSPDPAGECLVCEMWGTSP